MKTILALVLISVIFLSGCTNAPVPNVTQGKGTLTGKVMIGPLCPVERYPPDPMCKPTADTYKAWPIAVWSPNKVYKVAEIKPDLNGTYSLELPVGTYVVDLMNKQTFGARNLPATITIRAQETTTLNIDIDTGIR